MLEQPQQQQVTPILEVAWARFAQLDLASKKRSRSHLRLRRWIAVFGILATLFAILTETFPAKDYGIAGLVLQFLLIISPLTASGLAAYTAKFYSTGDWLVTRAGAEEILKEIYNYRTILKDSPHRRQWLEKRLAEIQRSVYRGMNGELTMAPYEGPLPPNYNPEDPYSDPGFNDLSGDEYFRYRVEYQLGWHVDRINTRQSERVRLQVLIILSGVLGAILAVVLPLWVALAASFTATFIGWQELRNLDAVVRNYSKVIMELNIIFDHWKNLTSEEQSQSEVNRMVQATEDTLWAQNVEYIKAMQEALKESDLDEEASLINRVIKEQRESDRRLQQSFEDAIVDYSREKMSESEERLEETYKTALNTLAEEASSELVQAELKAMQEALVEKFTSFKNALDNIAKEFEGVEIGPQTPPGVLNSLLARYPKSQEVKG